MTRGSVDQPETSSVSENIEISMSKGTYIELIDRSITKIYDTYSYVVALEIIEHDDVEPSTVAQCQARDDWPKWKDVIQAELDSLNKIGRAHV